MVSLKMIDVNFVLPVRIFHSRLYKYIFVFEIKLWTCLSIHKFCDCFPNYWSPSYNVHASFEQLFLPTLDYYLEIGLSYFILFSIFLLILSLLFSSSAGICLGVVFFASLLWYISVILYLYFKFDFICGHYCSMLHQKDLLCIILEPFLHII